MSPIRAIRHTSVSFVRKTLLLLRGEDFGDASQCLFCFTKCIQEGVIGLVKGKILCLVSFM